jgi:hypothetical protein
MAKILENTFRTFLSAIPVFMTFILSGQAPATAKLLDFRYGFQAPTGDLQHRFGGNNILGLGIESISHKSRQFYGLECGYIFGNTVKEDVLDPLRSYDGNIIGIDGQTGDVNLKERGFYVGLHAGKIFSTTDKKSSLTGIRAQIGIGLLQHKIRIQDNLKNIVPLNKEYLQGYDRLTNGPTIHLGVGYQYDSPYNNFHFKIMGDMMAGQTKSRRDLDYATGTYLNQVRTDILLGINVAYVVMISRTRTEENIYY